MKTSLTIALAAAIATAALLSGVDHGVARETKGGSAKTLSGVASWYGPRFHGRKTANGEKYDQNQMTAAHKSLPFNTRVRVTNRRNGKSVIVRINDRGPYIGRRVIDLSKGAASRVDMINSGIAPVTIEILPES